MQTCRILKQKDSYIQHFRMRRRSKQITWKFIKNLFNSIFENWLYIHLPQSWDRLQRLKNREPNSPKLTILLKIELLNISKRMHSTLNAQQRFKKNEILITAPKPSFDIYNHGGFCLWKWHWKLKCSFSHFVKMITKFSQMWIWQHSDLDYINFDPNN